MKNIKILYLDFNLPYLLRDISVSVGGATVQRFAWIQGLNANNCDIGVITGKGVRKNVGDDKLVHILESYDPKDGIRKIRWLSRYFILLKIIKKFNPDFIIHHCAGFETGIIAHIAKKLNIPFVYRIANDIDIDHRLKERLNYRQRIIFFYGLKHSSAIFCQNNYQLKRIKKILPKTHSIIIYNPFYYNGRLPPINEFSKRSYIAWIGIFQHQKNLSGLYKLVRNTPNMLFKIAGQNANSKVDKSTQKALERLRKCKNVEFVGYLKRSEVLPFLSKAYALLNTSHYEGFSNTYLESLAAGTPIITSKNVDPDNIISKYKLGVVMKNFAEFDYALNTIIEDKQYFKLSVRCRNYLLENHDTISLSRKLIDYLKLL